MLIIVKSLLDTEKFPIMDVAMKKKVFFIISILLILIAIPATIFLVGQQQELRKRAVPATTLSITPASLTKKVGDVFSLEIGIDAAENQVVAAELHVVFDPAKLEAQTITNSSLFPNILTSGVIERSSAAITVGAADVKKPVKGTGTIAVVRLKALEKTDTPATVRLAPNTFVGGLGEGATNVLVGTTPATVTIIDTTTTSTTPSLASSPTPLPTTTPPGKPSPTTTNPPTATIAATLAISSPASGSAVTTNTPTISGQASPGATVTITIYSTPQTVVVTADANGNWSYTPTTSLTSGSHNVVVSAPSPSGVTQTATTNFVIAAGSSPPASQSATIAPTAAPIPQSGTVSPTIVSLGLGMLIFVTGVLFSIAWVR